MRRCRAGLGLAVMVLIGSDRAGAAEVNAELVSPEAFVGVPAVLRISIVNARQHQPPQLPEIPGIAVRPAGPPSRSSQIYSINGRMTQTITVTYDFHLVADREGRYTIPAIEVQADGETLTTQPLTLVVNRSETGDLLFVELKGARRSLYVGEPLEATLQIWLRPYVDRRFEVRFGEGDMWARVDLQNSQWGPFLEVLQQMVQQRQRPRGREALRQDSSGHERLYYLYEIQRTLWPDRPGLLDVGSINVVVEYPRAMDRDRSIFSVGGLVITATRPISAQVHVEPVEVRAVPEEGRPPLYRGAVGQYTISAAATPTEVAVGDPVTLTLTIRGTGRLELLQPPPLTEIEPLNRDFRVPADPLGGQVQGDAKVFTTSIRARSPDVKQIPPIPFAYFDPAAERFVTVETEPIPLVVSGVDRVSAAAIVDAARGEQPSRLLTEVSGGILANYTGMDEVLRSQTFSPGWGSAVALAAPPVVWLACWWGQRRSLRFRNDPALARRRRARRQALRRLAEAERAGTPAERATRVADALLGYIADRLNLPPGSLTRQDALKRLVEAGCSASTIEQIDRLLSACEAVCYGSAAESVDEGDRARAEQSIRELEKSLRGG